METTFPRVSEQPISWGAGLGLHQVRGYKAIVSQDTGKVFSVVSKDYRLIPHEKAIEAVEELIHKNEDLGNPEITTDFYNDGGRMRRRYRFHEAREFIEPGDELNPELHLYNSYDVSWPLTVALGAYRVVCKNGMVVHKDLFRFKKRHVVEMDRMDFKEDVATILDRFNEQVGKWKKWRKRPISLETYEKIITEMKLGKIACEEIESKVNEKSDTFLFEGVPEISAWILFNILTWYITHRTVSLNHRVELEGRLRRAMAHFN